MCTTTVHVHILEQFYSDFILYKKKLIPLLLFSVYFFDDRGKTDFNILFFNSWIM